MMKVILGFLRKIVTFVSRKKFYNEIIFQH